MYRSVEELGNGRKGSCSIANHHDPICFLRDRLTINSHIDPWREVAESENNDDAGVVDTDPEIRLYLRVIHEEAEANPYTNPDLMRSSSKP